MRDLALVALSENGRYLIARDPASGTRFRLRVDHKLSDLVATSAGTVPGQLEIPMESTLTPREIQARIRRGESVAEVAEAASSTVEAIMGFATPVLAEREYVVEQARSTTVRRRNVGGTPVALGTLVDEAATRLDVSSDDVAWQSRRRDDGLWVIEVQPIGHEPAHFVFDAKSRYVLPDDEAARQLVGDLATDDQVDMAIADAVTATTPDSRTSPSPEPEAAQQQRVHSLTEARQRRAQDILGEDDEPAAPRRDGRRSVPSWDEIMFGGRRE